ncbi:MAG: copper-binding protein [Nitrosomonadales bacterium]|nr:copper-binding protein [Nitrosomonadales bacterium]
MQMPSPFPIGMMLFMALNTAPALAETPEPDKDMMHHKMAMDPANSMKHEGYGVLKAVNAERGKVQIAHEAIPELRWPAMPMWFTLRDPLPNGISVGDAVRFEMMKSNPKSNPQEWVIIRIERKR